ncbi:cingulin [Melitaea cinxia]|uniref:cingulin n=1 Tax=Melitaea cinxia TaxID=113334 RepID=UPI001E271436|nr:cingulin [Melitaea cinxia]
MEVDSVEGWNNNPPDGAKFANLKAFVNAAREFEATHSESAINLMTRYLGLIASSCDLSIFSPGRSEVCAFFSSLWRAMRDGRGPHWAGIAVLARASVEPSARHALTHTYKFMPILSQLLSDTISNDKKIKLLSVMQDISYGIKISWQESYLTGLMKQLTDWILQPVTEPQHRAIGHKSLTVLVNVCYGNLPAIYALMRTVDTKDFVVHLISMKDGGYGGVEVCRLLLCLSSGTRGSAAIRQPDIHSYLCCTMRTFSKAIVDRDATQLLHAYTFINDLYTDNNLRNFVLTYPNFTSALQESIPKVDDLCKMTQDDVDEPENLTSCVQNVLKFLTVLVNLDLYSLRCHHCQLVCLCMKSSRLCLPESLELFAAIISQYRDEGVLPQELTSVIVDGLPALLVPPSLEPGKVGLQWLKVVGALCESSETQEHVLQEVTPDSFEDTLYSVLQFTSQNGPVGVETAQQSVVLACRSGLILAPLSKQWEAAFNRMLAHHQVRKLLCVALTSNNGSRRRQILQLIKHHYFPSDQMNQIFGESLQNMGEAESPPRSPRSDACAAERLAPAQERQLDRLLAQLAAALQAGKRLAPAQERQLDRLLAQLAAALQAGKRLAPAQERQLDRLLAQLAAALQAGKRLAPAQERQLDRLLAQLAAALQAGKRLAPAQERQLDRLLAQLAAALQAGKRLAPAQERQLDRLLAQLAAALQAGKRLAPAQERQLDRLLAQLAAALQAGKRLAPAQERQLDRLLAQLAAALQAGKRLAPAQERQLDRLLAQLAAALQAGKRLAPAQERQLDRLLAQLAAALQAGKRLAPAQERQLDRLLAQLAAALQAGKRLAPAQERQLDRLLAQLAAALQAGKRLAPAQERQLDRLLAQLAAALQAGKISDIATSSVMELYGYKMTCLEHRLHSHSLALQGATEHMASLQHSLALLQATNSAQQDVLYTTQMQNEKHKKSIEDLHKQLEDAEKTLRGFRAKLAAERLDKENQKEILQKEFRTQLTNIENEMKIREREAEERLKQLESDNKALQKKLEQQTNKNSELAGVLIKFEERVKQRDKKLEEAAASDSSLRRELEQRDNMIKQLEKTVVERENRLYQVTTQLEEMKRVQEMVAKLMSKSSSTAAS